MTNAEITLPENVRCVFSASGDGNFRKHFLVSTIEMELRHLTYVYEGYVGSEIWVLTSNTLIKHATVPKPIFLDGNPFFSHKARQIYYLNQQKKKKDRQYKAKTHD